MPHTSNVAPATAEADPVEASKAVKPAGQQRSIQSIEIGFRLIRALENAPGPLTLKELAMRAGMTPSKAHFYLVSFKRVGLVAQNPDNGQYLLGRYALDLGLSALRRLNLIEIAREKMRHLSSELGESVFLSVWGNRGPTIVCKVDGPRRIPMTLQIGYVLPLTRSATGHIFLTYLPHDMTELMLREETTLMSQERDAFDVAALRARIAEAGMAETDGLLNEGTTGISTPVWNHQRELAGALTIITPTESSKAMVRRNAEQLGLTARKLSQAFGAS
jgi:DNA-binding IclR family transcriptional regulator